MAINAFSIFQEQGCGCQAYQVLGIIRNAKGARYKAFTVADPRSLVRRQGGVGSPAMVCTLTARVQECSCTSFDCDGYCLQQSVDGLFPNNESDSHRRDIC